MKNTAKIILTLSLAVLLLASCKEETDLILERVEAPVLLQYDSIAPTTAQATFFDLDKSGILDQNVGIQYDPIANLTVEVMRSGNSLGTFTTGGDGTFTIEFDEGLPDEFAGNYDGISFRIFKNDFD